MKLLIFLLALCYSTATADELREAVEKLIMDVHNLKVRVADLEAKINRKIKKQTADSSHSSITVVRGELVKSRTSCCLLTTKRTAEKEKSRILSLLSPDAPLYVKEWKGYYVYLTLPRYCSTVKERVKDAFITAISIP